MPVAIIPARVGSKRIPRKNIRLFRGRPMIAWSISAAINASVFEQIIVSTDDEETADIARTLGADVPFLRPSSLSDDHVMPREVIRHAIYWLSQERSLPDAVCCIFATAPFLQSSDLLAASSLLPSIPSQSFIYTATSYPYPIQRALRIDSSGFSTMYQPDFFNVRSQDLEDSYHDAGQFYLARTDAWLGTTSYFENGYPLILPRWRVQDIDIEEDWIRAEYLHEIIDKSSPA